MTPLATTICGALTALVLGMAGLFFVPALPGGATTSQDARTATQAPASGWTTDVLAGLGNGQPTTATVAFLEAWARAEGGSATFNWLNTTQPALGATDYNSVGVKNYPDYATGVRATVETLMNGFYPRTLAGLQANAPIVDDDEMGVWGTGGSAVRRQLEETRAVSLPTASVTSAAYLLQGDVGTNVRAALNANGGALQAFEIAPGQTWSFGRSIAPISALGHLPVVCGPAGCNAGGGWCDLSALYVNVADQLGLQSDFPAHIGVSDTRFPGILLDEQGNGGDLLITNTTGAVVRFSARVDGGSVIVEGGY
jgi:hypothetical protein